MSLLDFIYMAGIAAIFLIIGMVIEYSIDAQIIRETHQENQKLKLKLETEQLKRQSEVIEIIDRRSSAREISFPNTEGI